MKITIECNSLEELQEAVDTIALVFPERSEKIIKKEKKPETTPSRGGKIDRETIRKLMEEGHTKQEIAEIVGCGYSTVCNIVRELNG